MHIVFYTISEDKRVADLLVINDAQPVTVKSYDCPTGELEEEKPARQGFVGVFYVAMLYEDGRWRERDDDVIELVPVGEIEVQATIDLVLGAQGRLP
jgi:hypothetical protein